MSAHQKCLRCGLSRWGYAKSKKPCNLSIIPGVVRPGPHLWTKPKP